MLFRKKQSKIVLLFMAVLLIICTTSFIIYKLKIIHIGNIYWINCGQSSNGIYTSMIIHRYRIILKANIEAMGYYPFLYVVFFPTDNPFLEKEGTYAKIDVRNGFMQIVDGSEVAHFSNKYHLHFQNHRQVLRGGNEFWQNSK